MNWKDIILWIVLFVVGSLIVTFLVSPNSFSNFKSNIKEITPSISNINSPSNNASVEKVLTDFEDINRNPENYLDKEVTITGEYEGSWILISGSNNAVSLIDGEGYRAYFVPRVNRAFQEGRVYSITGVMKKINPQLNQNNYAVMEG